jgi:ribosomal protein L4
MKKTVFSLKNKTVGDMDLDTSIFGIKQLPDLIHQYIRYQNAKSRQGSPTVLFFKFRTVFFIYDLLTESFK